MTVLPLTSTRPWVISSSAARRDATPAVEMIFWRRSSLIQHLRPEVYQPPDRRAARFRLGVVMSGVSTVHGDAGRRSRASSAVAGRRARPSEDADVRRLRRIAPSSARNSPLTSRGARSRNGLDRRDPDAGFASAAARARRRESTCERPPGRRRDTTATCSSPRRSRRGAGTRHRGRSRSGERAAARSGSSAANSTAASPTGGVSRRPSNCASRSRPRPAQARRPRRHGRSRQTRHPVRERMTRASSAPCRDRRPASEEHAARHREEEHRNHAAVSGFIATPRAPKVRQRPGSANVQPASGRSIPRRRTSEPTATNADDAACRARAACRREAIDWSSRAPPRGKAGRGAHDKVANRVVSKPLIIAIDGPSGAGKGTVARALAARARLPPHRHRRDVSRAGVEGAARRRRSRRRGGHRGARRARRRSTSKAGGSGSTATT